MRPLDGHLRRHADLTAPVDGHELVSAGVGPSGELLVLWATPATDAAWVSTTFGQDRGYAAPLRGRLPDHPYIQPMPGGGFLAVDARCEWHPSDPEHNALRFDAAGDLVATGVLGDGIEHVQTTSSGQIWVAYYDEGVFGNHGWRKPIGAPGIIRFTPDFEIGWSFPDWGIADCYVLNVTGEVAWACYYTGFPIVRIDGAVSSWATRAEGPSALIVDGDRAALVGSYDDSDRIVYGRLEGPDFLVEGTGRLTMPDGESLPEDARVWGRAHELHVLAGMTWYKLGIRDL